MISYKYKLYRTDKTKHLDKMLREADFVWNHALALQKRYYRMYHKYIGSARMKAHFVKHISRNLLHSQSVQEMPTSVSSIIWQHDHQSSDGRRTFHQSSSSRVVIP